MGGLRQITGRRNLTMTTTEQLIVLGVSVWVAYLVGQSQGRKLPGTAPKPDTNTVSDSPSAMDWFVNWGGLK